MPNKKEIEAIKTQSIENLEAILNTAIRAMSLGDPTPDEWTLIVHMVTWIGEIHDYQDAHIVTE